MINLSVPQFIALARARARQRTTGVENQPSLCWTFFQASKKVRSTSTDMVLWNHLTFFKIALDWGNLLIYCKIFPY